ncbi:hypothetical protein SLEP1_g15076 [Rubroshorea leprosula]|uniref:Transposase (Putative), gypsy type n=1 Tax=Rubroshorea leprosula TaxID=152421 RepID=A0AAV5IXX2_9ROSI|nr:hypothetical protein SLEP1_g15076 [Rubroshorea leprosula]
MGYETSLENRGGLAHLVENYGVLGRVLVRPAGKRERACSAPGDHWMPLYSHYLVAGLRFPILDLLVWLLLKYCLGLTQLTPNAVSGKEKGWYYFTGRVVNKQRNGLFSAGPSSIKGWKGKFFFVDDTEWDKTDVEVEHLSRWKATGLNLNEYSLIPGELEDVRMLERGGESRLDVMEYTSQRIRDEQVFGGSRNIGDEVTVVEEGPIIAKRKRMEQQEVVKEVPEPMTSSLRIEGTSSATTVEFAAALWEQGQRAKDEVVARGSVGVICQALEAVNLMNALANEHHESLKERNQMRKDNAKLIKKNEEAEAEVAKLKAEMEELRKENATLKKDSELSYQNRKICEDELEKREKELEEVAKAAVELELKVHNSIEELVEGFLKSSTFEDIVNLYRLPTAIVAFSDCRKKVKLQYPDVDVMKIMDNRGQTILPPKFSFEFVAVGDDGSEGADNLDQPVD